MDNETIVDNMHTELAELLTYSTGEEPERVAVEMTREESAAILIEEFSAIKEVRQGTYNRLHATVVGCKDYAEADKLLSDAEDIYIKACFTAEQIAEHTTKGGKIKKTKFLPNDYTSAKSVLLSCLEKGIALVGDDGEALGKSALSKATSGSSKSAEQQLSTALDAVIRYAKEVYGDGAFTVEVKREGVRVENRVG